MVDAGLSRSHTDRNTTPNSGGIRVGDWKLVVAGGTVLDEDEAAAAPKKAQAANRVELFNLANDPYEKQDLAATNPAKVKELRARYDAFSREAVPPKSRPKPPGFQSPKVWGEVE